MNQFVNTVSSVVINPWATDCYYVYYEKKTGIFSAHAWNFNELPTYWIVLCRKGMGRFFFPHQSSYMSSLHGNWNYMMKSRINGEVGTREWPSHLHEWKTHVPTTHTEAECLLFTQNHPISLLPVHKAKKVGKLWSRWMEREREIHSVQSSFCLMLWNLS